MLHEIENESYVRKSSNPNTESQNASFDNRPKNKKDLELKKAEEKLAEAQRMIEQARKDYTKDTTNLRGQVDRLNIILDQYTNSRTAKTTYDYIKVQYYESTDFVDPELIELINAKVKEIEKKYNLSLA